MKNILRKIIIFFCLQLLHTVTLFAQWNSNKTINNEVATEIGRQESAVMCSDGAGGAIIAWYDSRGWTYNTLHDVFVQRINSNGVVQWATDGISLNVLTNGYGDIDIAADGNGGAVIAFISGSGSTLLILAQRVDGNGNSLWNSGNPVTVCNAVEAQFHPRVVNAGNSTFVITWQDERAGTNVDDIYAQKYDLNGLAQWAANGVLVNAALSYQEDPEIVSIGSGEVIVTWSDFRSGSNYDVYAQKLNAAGVRQWVGTDGLLSGKIISNATANQRYPKICTDANNGAIISWQDFRNGGTNATDIYAQRINTSGAVQWTPNGELLCNRTTVQEIQNIIFTNDGAVVSWIDYPTGTYDYDLYAQKVDLNGGVKWATNGVVVCNAPDIQSSIQSAADGSNGAIFTWIDRRDGIVIRNTLYAQRINSIGQPVWTLNGVVVSNNSLYSRNNPRIISDGCTTIFVWEDSRNTGSALTDFDIYATAFDCNGNVVGSSSQISWIGTISTDWTNTGNWSTGKVPTSNDDVLIPSGTSFSPVINDGILGFCKSIQFNSGASIIVATGGNLKVGL
jgi:hypothetical protein